jgi:hypothetical protein
MSRSTRSLVGALVAGPVVAFCFALAALVLPLLGLPATGGPAGPAYLPPFFGWLSDWLPAGVATRAMRATVYFGGHGVGSQVTVLAIWAAAAVVLLLVTRLVRHRPARRPVTPAELATADA